jgi:uncharacterized membrane-anchored protein
LEEAPETQRTTSEAWSSEDNQVANNDSERRELEALRLSARAQRAIATLENHQKSLAQECSERRKRLRKIIVAIQQREQMGTLALEGLDAIELAPADQELIHDPMRGL